MEIKNAIIHNVEKELKGHAKIQYSEHTSNLKDEKCLSLFKELYTFFSKTIKYGIFSTKENTIFHQKFDDYLEQLDKTGKNFFYKRQNYANKRSNTH